MRDVVLRPRAVADLAAIARYTATQWGDAQGRRYLQAIRQQIAAAAEMPGIGSPVAGLPAEYRKIRSGAHRAIYRCSDRQLIVVRIIHEREDVPDDDLEA